MVANKTNFTDNRYNINNPGARKEALTRENIEKRKLFPKLKHTSFHSKRINSQDNTSDLNGLFSLINEAKDDEKGRSGDGKVKIGKPLRLKRITILINKILNVIYKEVDKKTGRLL